MLWRKSGNSKHGLFLHNNFLVVVSSLALLSAFVGAFVGNHQKRTTLPAFDLFSTAPGNDNNNNDDEGEEQPRKRKRDVFKDWMTSGSEDPLVTPVQKDGSQVNNPPSGRVKTNFEGIFAGMPSLSDIVSGSSSDQDTSGYMDDRREDGDRQKLRDDSWFDGERAEIEANYQQIEQQMLAELTEQRSRDPDSVPANAESMLKTILAQEMEEEIGETRDDRMKELLNEYAEEQRASVEDSPLLGQVDESVQKLIDDSEDEFSRREASRVELEDFLRYEEEAVRRTTSAGVPSPTDGEDLDAWALDRMEDMASQQQFVDGGENVLDNLEGNVDELRDRIQRDSLRDPIQHDDLKDWQMYRSIATKYTCGNETMEPEFESKINDQLESWKDYVRREDRNRRQSGLTGGEDVAERGDSIDRSRTVRSPSDRQAEIETRKKLNRMSIEAMESLFETSDTQRREKLGKEIAYLKAELEYNDYLDVDEAAMLLAEEEAALEPVDLADVFTSNVDSPEPAPVVMQPEIASLPPPASSFYAVKSDDISEVVQKAPATPFFSETADVDAVSDKLGTVEEQKLEAMLRRSGARSSEERERIREQWEQFQEFEQQRREQWGLSGDDDAMSRFEAQYDTTDMLKSDGDIDAEKILSAIGPRPTRSKKKPVSPASDDAQANVDSPQDQDVIDSLYRTVSSAGGGRYRDDPDEDARKKSSFTEYFKKESEMRESLDEIDENSIEPETAGDDVEYASEVLASLGPRPGARKARVIDEGDFSDQGGVLASEDDDEDDDEPPAVDDELPEVPEWLQKEREDAARGNGVTKGGFLGSEMDEIFDDTDYDKQMRQLAEYERRRAGRSRQMGIDISDVLGSGRENYVDYKFEAEYQRGRQGDGWGNVGFAKRQADLLEYRELQVAELNSLMDFKDSPYATGVSPYMPRINKPFKEFGALFRLEGVLVDITGLQQKAWTRVAADHGYRIPSKEEAMRAGVTRSDIAVRECLFWTDDVSQCRKLSDAHRKAFRRAFDEWMKANGIKSPDVAPRESSLSQGSLAIGDEATAKEEPVQQQIKPPSSESEAIELASKVWAKTAEQLGRSVPTTEEVASALLVSPDVAAIEVFKWTTDRSDADTVAATYRWFREDLRGVGTTTPSPKVEASEQMEPSVVSALSEEEVMEFYFKAWTDVAREQGFESPDPDQVLAAFVIRDPVLVVREGFGWTQNPNTVSATAELFEQTLQTYITGRGLNPNKTTSPKDKEAKPAQDQGPSYTPKGDELFKASLDAWTAVAASSGYGAPDMDEVEFSLTVGPEEAVATGFQWTTDENEVSLLVEKYRDELAKRRSSWSSSSGGKRAPAMTDRKVPKKKEANPDDVFKAALDAWSNVAKSNGWDAPDLEEVQFALTVGAEEAIRTGFGWSEDEEEVVKIAKAYKDEVSRFRHKWSRLDDGRSKATSKEEELQDVVVIPGVDKWIKSLLNVDMQCGVMSFLDQDHVETLIHHAGLADQLPREKQVTANSGYPRESQQALGVALRLERRPDHCVLFDSSPSAAAAAHEVEMRSVSLIGPFPRYELLSSDCTTNTVNELTAMNIRRLFGERVYDQPQLDIQQNEPETRNTVKTRFFWDDN